MFLGADIGFVLGAINGAVHKTERWEEVPLERLRVGITPTPGGQALVLSLRF
jgi:hypothetical protein